MAPAERSDQVNCPYDRFTLFYEQIWGWVAVLSFTLRALQYLGAYTSINELL